jgi:hypothetical protein
MRLKAHASVADSKWAAIKHQVHQALRVKRTIGWKIPKAETAWGVEYEGRDEAERTPQRTNPFSKHQSTRKDEVNEDGKQRVIKKW